jgi:hypothetical protein
MGVWSKFEAYSIIVLTFELKVIALGLDYFKQF